MSHPFQYRGFTPPFPPTRRRKPALPLFLGAFLFTTLFVALLGIAALPLGAVANDGEDVTRQVVILVLMLGITFEVPAFVFVCLGIRRLARNRRTR